MGHLVEVVEGLASYVEIARSGEIFRITSCHSVNMMSEKTVTMTLHQLVG